jgi:hypothetical protein
MSRAQLVARARRQALHPSLRALVDSLRITHNFPERALVNWLGRC